MNIDFLHNIYQQSLLENDRNIKLWEKYIADLNALDFKTYSDKLTVPMLVPIGSRVLFRGELKHTNEVTVALGADYFVKCSLAQAEVLRDHRIKNAKSKLEVLIKEKDYLEKQVSFGQQSLSRENGHDIIEVCTKEEDEAWRKEHRENVRKYKQRKDKHNEEQTNEMTEAEVWDRLEELELQEEIQNELTYMESKQIIVDNENNNKSEDNSNSKENNKIEDNSNSKENNKIELKNDTESEDQIKEPTEPVNRHSDSDDDSDLDVNDYTLSKEELAERMRVINESYTHFMNRPNLKNEPKLELMHEIIGRHKLILEALAQFKKEKKAPCTSENDLLLKLDELEKVEELEDEMERLEDMINGCESENEDEEVQESDSKLKKSVSFADGDSSETVQLTFKHSDVEPSHEGYDPTKGILKPSDIPEAYAAKLNETTSILKKTNYVSPTREGGTNIDIKQSNQEENHEAPDSNLGNAIVIKDVVEKTDCNDNTVDNNKRPMSLFKKKRQQQKM